MVGSQGMLLSYGSPPYYSAAAAAAQAAAARQAQVASNARVHTQAQAQVHAQTHISASTFVPAAAAVAAADLAGTDGAGVAGAVDKEAFSQVKTAATEATELVPIGTVAGAPAGEDDRNAIAATNSALGSTAAISEGGSQAAKAKAVPS